MRSEMRLSIIALRVALSAGFLSAVADRFGLWGPLGSPGVAWGNFPEFLAYTGKLLPFLPASLVAVAGWAATVAEFVLALALLVNIRVRLAAYASAALLLTFALAMTATLGPEPPLSYSVWTAAAGAFLLAANSTSVPRDSTMAV